MRDWNLQAVYFSCSAPLSSEAYGDAFRLIFAKEPKLITKSLEILEAGAQAVRVLETPVMM